jgi:hypothetical protein
MYTKLKSEKYKNWTIQFEKNDALIPTVFAFVVHGVNNKDKSWVGKGRTKDEAFADAKRFLNK